MGGMVRLNFPEGKWFNWLKMIMMNPFGIDIMRFRVINKGMKNAIIIIGLIIGILSPSLLFAVETAPRISDREIVERLTRLEEGQTNIEKRIDNLDKSLNNRIDDLRSEMNGRFDTIQWMLGLFIAIALVILGFVLRMQWQMHRRQTQMETTLNMHKDDLAFLKGLIEKLLPPKGVL